MPSDQHRAISLATTLSSGEDLDPLWAMPCGRNGETYATGGPKQSELPAEGLSLLAVNPVYSISQIDETEPVPRVDSGALVRNERSCTTAENTSLDGQCRPHACLKIGEEVCGSGQVAFRASVRERYGLHVSCTIPGSFWNARGRVNDPDTSPVAAGCLE